MAKKKEPKKTGCKPKYSREISKKITDLLKEDSYTVVEIAKMVGIHMSTFYAWQAAHEEFSEAIKAAREARLESFAMDAEYSLRKLINGFSVKETKTNMVPDGKGGAFIENIEEKTKYFQPSATAIIFALTNRDPSNWRNKHSVEIDESNDKALEGRLSKLPIEALLEIEGIIDGVDEDRGGG